LCKNNQAESERRISQVAGRTVIYGLAEGE